MYVVFVADKVINLSAVRLLTLSGVLSYSWTMTVVSDSLQEKHHSIFRMALICEWAGQDVDMELCGPFGG